MKRSIQLALSLMLLACLSSVHAKGHGVVRASGDFTVEIDFSTLSLTPVNGDCLIVVEGFVTFTGTLQGIAFSRTRALAAASCDQVALQPPGNYEDVFTSALEFAGTVDGRPVVADLTYRGDTALGGAIDAVLVPSNGLGGRLRVDGIVAAGGTYRGFLRFTDR